MERRWMLGIMALALAGMLIPLTASAEVSTNLQTRDRMQNGKVVDRGDRDAILKQSKVEYTRSLMAAVPTLEGFRYN